MARQDVTESAAGQGLSVRILSENLFTCSMAKASKKPLSKLIRFGPGA